jgi:hypothetical protein
LQGKFSVKSLTHPGIELPSDPSYHGLKSLDLSGNELKRGVQVIADILSWHPTLEQLSLRDNKLNYLDLITICHALHKNTVLKSLDLSGNLMFTREGIEVVELKDFLVTGSSIEELFLNNVGMSEEATIALAESLPMIGNLRILHIQYNPINVAGVMALSVAMKMNHSIIELEVTPVLNTNPEDEYLAHLLNDISMYMQRNMEMVKTPKYIYMTRSERDSRFHDLILNIPNIEDTTKLLDDVLSGLEQSPAVGQCGRTESQMDLVNVILNFIYFSICTRTV